MPTCSWWPTARPIQILVVSTNDLFMYYEDVDLCRRMWTAGWKVNWQPGVGDIHDARRASHRRMPHLRRHATSASRFLTGM